MNNQITPFQVLVSLALSVVVAVYAIVFFDGDAMWYRLWYYVPAAALAGGFVAERLKLRLWQVARKVLLFDLAIAAICLARPFFHWPPASGHALFCVYALITSENRWVKVLAGLVLVITFYAKLWLWHGDVTLWSGLAVGLVVGTVYRRFLVNLGDNAFTSMK